MHMYDLFGGHWIWMVAWWGVLIFVIVLIVRALRNTDGAAMKDEPPLDILRKRFARGEISRSTFEDLRNTLLHSYNPKEN